MVNFVKRDRVKFIYFEIFKGKIKTFCVHRDLVRSQHSSILSFSKPCLVKVPQDNVYLH